MNNNGLKPILSVQLAFHMGAVSFNSLHSLVLLFPPLALIRAHVLHCTVHVPSSSIRYTYIQ